MRRGRFSCDSRFYGLVARSALIGKVFEIKRGSKEIDIPLASRRPAGPFL